ncbi:MAG TPA: DUF4097 family beta strand repeat-containing protein [Candidatus Angelobacter sp.]|nr:DUF4097 family beta strand repeat-containing protein [Candidatus Angelobacter sp.]
MPARSDFQERQEETIQKSFSVDPSGHDNRLEVDNVNGSIEVIGSTSGKIELVVNEVIRAESKEKLEKARKEVTLDATQEGGLVKLYVNGPFRCHCDDGCEGWRERGYSVKMDFHLQVPAAIAVNLKTVNEGHILVRNVTGGYSLRNVNGDIEMDDATGSGQVRTVNGKLKVGFRENPHESSDFKSLNGNIDLSFAKNLAADFRFKTLNGRVFSDFPMTALAPRQGEAARTNGKFVFRADRSTGGRVGSGGPEINVENLNGNISILERQ